MASITELVEMHRKTLKGDDGKELADCILVRATRAAGGPFFIHLGETTGEKYYPGGKRLPQALSSMQQDGRLIAAALYLRLPSASSHGLLRALADLMPTIVGPRADDSAYWKGEYTEEAEKLAFVRDELDEVRKENKRLHRTLATIVSTASYRVQEE